MEFYHASRFRDPWPGLFFVLHNKSSAIGQLGRRGCVDWRRKGDENWLQKDESDWEQRTRATVVPYLAARVADVINIGLVVMFR